MTVDSQVTLPLDDIITLVLTDEVLEEATSALFEKNKETEEICSLNFEFLSRRFKLAGFKMMLNNLLGFI